MTDVPTPQLVIQQQPTDVAAGSSITPAIIVRVEREGGTLITAFDGLLTVSLDAGPFGAELSGTTSVAAVAGVATFDDLTLDLSGPGYVLEVAAENAISVESAPFSVVPGAPASLEFSVEPTASVAGEVISPAVKVRAMDAEGNLATQFTGDVTVALATSPPGAVLDGTLTAAAVAGVATFDDLSVSLAGTGYRLIATSGALDDALTGAWAATPPPTPRLDFHQQPTSVVAGASISPAVVIRAEDESGALLPGYGGLVTVALHAGPVGAELSGTKTVAAVDGVATFSDLSLDVTGAGYVLEATASGVTATLSASFSVTPGSAEALEFSVQPTPTTVGVQIDPAVSVRALDAYGNLATSFAELVTVGLASGPGGGALSGTLTVTAVAGIASFGDLSVNVAGGGYSLAATATGVAGATSATWTAIDPAGTNEWTNAAGGSWSIGTNWSLGRAPIVGDAIVIGLAGTYTVVLDLDFTAEQLTIGDAVGDQTLQVAAGRTLTLANATVAGDGVILNSGTLRMHDATVSPSIEQQGLLECRGDCLASGGMTTIGGANTMVSGSTAHGAATLTVAGGLTNLGILELSAVDVWQNATIAVTGGRLVNATGAAILVPGGIEGGSRTIAAQLQNDGTITIVKPLLLAHPSADHTNSAIINIAESDLTVTQTGSSPSFTNTGTIFMNNPRIWVVNGGALNLVNGVVTGGRISTNGVTLALATSAVKTGLNLTLTTIPAGVTIPAGDSLRLQGGTLDTPTIDNHGVLVGAGTVASIVTTHPGSVIRPLNGTLTFANGFTNTARIDLGSLAVTNGTLVNAPGAEIRGLGGGLQASLDNQGTVEIFGPFSIVRAGATITNSGTIDANTWDLDVVMSAGGTFTNTGTILLGQSRRLTVSGGTVNLTSGLVDNPTAILSTSSATLNFSFDAVKTRFALGTTTTIPGTLSVPAGDTMHFSGIISAPVLIDGVLLADGTSGVASTIAYGAQGKLQLRAATGNVTFTVPPGFTNTGLIEMSSPNSDRYVRLESPLGTIVNAASGALLVTGANERRITALQFDNNGTLTIDAGTTLTMMAPLRLLDGSVTTVNGTLIKSGGCTQSGTIVLTGTTCP